MSVGFPLTAFASRVVARGDATQLPYADGTFDAVTGLRTYDEASHADIADFFSMSGFFVVA